MRGDERKALLLSGIGDIVVGSILMTYGIWSTSQIHLHGTTWSETSTLSNSVFMIWMMIIGSCSFGVGVSSILLREIQDKYWVLWIYNILLLCLVIVFILTAGIRAAAYVGGFYWLFVALPFIYGPISARLTIRFFSMRS